jgi:hypothetical protein
LEDFERCGVVGERTNKLVGYLWLPKTSSAAEIRNRSLMREVMSGGTTEPRSSSHGEDLHVAPLPLKDAVCRGRSPATERRRASCASVGAVTQSAPAHAVRS